MNPCLGVITVADEVMAKVSNICHGCLENIGMSNSIDTIAKKGILTDEAIV